MLFIKYVLFVLINLGEVYSETQQLKQKLSSHSLNITPLKSASSDGRSFAKTIDLNDAVHDKQQQRSHNFPYVTLRCDDRCRCSCICPSGWTNSRCNILLDTCETNPCGLTDECHAIMSNDYYKDYICVCDQREYYGPNCQRKVPNPCINNSEQCFLFMFGQDIYVHCDKDGIHFLSYNPASYGNEKRKEYRYARLSNDGCSTSDLETNEDTTGGKIFRFFKKLAYASIAGVGWLMLFFVMLQWYKYRAAEAQNRNVESPYNPANAIGRLTIRSHRLYRLS